MHELRTLHQRAGALVYAKLGRCPGCIRSSIVGSLVAWAAFALVGLVWAHPVPMLLCTEAGELPRLGPPSMPPPR